MKRFSDWEKRLHVICSQRMHAPFSFGVNDCAMFAADAIHVMTGLDIAAEVRGQYDSRESSQTLLAGLTGGGWLEEYAVLVANREGMQEVGIRFARRGDMVLMHQEVGPSLGIVSLDGMRALFAGVDGLERFPVLDCSRAWRV